MLGVDHKSVTDWWSFRRDLCSWDLLNNPVQLGGPGRIVTMDETVVARAKPTTNGRTWTVPPQWVFGTVDPTTGDFFMELVTQSDGATLIPIIQRNVVPGSRIWRMNGQHTKNGLIAAGYQHETVNRSQHFVNPVTGIHTNTTEVQ